MADMTAEQYGPTERITRRCSDCKACVSESYKCQSDSGHDVYCAHPSLPERKLIGDTTWSTPDWCPAIAARLSGMAAVPAWQPIETAPKDGRLVLLARPTSVVPFMGGYCQSRGWLDSYGHSRDPSHWQPLPNTPEVPTC